MKKCLILLLCMLLLNGCGKEEVEEVILPVEPPVSEQASEGVFDGYTITAIGPVCGFIDYGDSLEIYPYYDSVQHITIEKILLSDLPYWETIKDSQSETAVISEYDNYSMITTVDGTTYGYYEESDNWAIIAYSDTLPSSYVKAVMLRICQQDT